jgi:hypothetical protein
MRLPMSRSMAEFSLRVPSDKELAGFRVIEIILSPEFLKMVSAASSGFRIEFKTDCTLFGIAFTDAANVL